MPAHARLGQGLKLKRPVLIRGGDARISEPASHRAETPCRMSDFLNGLFARQVPCETVVQAAVQKLLGFWTAPSLVALSPCLGDDQRRASRSRTVLKAVTSQSLVLFDSSGHTGPA